MAIVNAQLTTTALNILVVPVEKSYAITNILVCNTSLSASASFDLHLIPFGDTLSNAVTIVVRNLTLPPGETFTFDSERIILDQGDKITFVAEPSIGSGLTNLAATVSYLEV